MSSTQYMKNEINIVERPLKDGDRQLIKVYSSVKQPLPNGYQTELRQSDELIPELVSSYLQLIDILRWAVDLGRIKILTEVVVMPQ